MRCLQLLLSGLVKSDPAAAMRIGVLQTATSLALLTRTCRAFAPHQLAVVTAAAAAAVSFPAAAAMRKWNVADPHFIGYTYKNWEAVHSGGELPPELAAVQMKKKTPARPTLQQLQSNLQAMGIGSEAQQQQQQQQAQQQQGQQQQHQG
jgi:hypothetical protein